MQNVDKISRDMLNDGFFFYMRIRFVIINKLVFFLLLRHDFRFKLLFSFYMIHYNIVRTEENEYSPHHLSKAEMLLRNNFEIGLAADKKKDIAASSFDLPTSEL